MNHDGFSRGIRIWGQKNELTKICCVFKISYVRLVVARASPSEAHCPAGAGCLDIDCVRVKVEVMCHYKDLIRTL